MEFDFSKLKWRIDQVPLDKSVIAFYPDLGEIFKEYIDKIEALTIPTDKFIRFVVLCYAEKSPLVDKIDDVNVRKRKALAVINFDHDLLKQPITNETIGFAILQFLKFENHTKHMNLMMYQEALCKFQLDLINAKNPKTTLEGIEKLQNLIEKTADSHYQGDAELGNYSGSFSVTEKRKIFPEEQ